jgi:hypothetical protein
LRIKTVKATYGDWLGLQRTLLSAGVVRDQLQVLLTRVAVTAPAPRDGATDASGGDGWQAAGAAYVSGDGGNVVGDDGAAGDGGHAYSEAAPFLMRQLVDDFSDDLSFLHNMLAAVIDWPASKSAARLTVQHGLDPTLDEYRRVYAGTAASHRRLPRARHRYPPLPPALVRAPAVCVRSPWVRRLQTCRSS